MKVIRQTSTRLTLRTIPWSTWILGVVLLAWGSSLGLIIWQSVNLTCDRTTTQACELIYSGVFKQEKFTFPVRNLSLDKIEVENDPKYGSIYRIIIPTDQGKEMEFITRGATLTMQSQGVYDIYTFIQTPDLPQLNVSENTGRQVALILIVFGSAGLAALSWPKVMIYDFDKNAGKLSCGRFSLLGSEIHQIALENILGPTVETAKTIGEDFLFYGLSFDLEYRLIIVLKDEETIPVNFADNRSPTRHEKIAARIQLFLGLPLLPPPPPFAISDALLSELICLMKDHQLGREATIQKCRYRLQRDPCDVEACQMLAIALAAQGDRLEVERVLEIGQTQCQGKNAPEQARYLEQMLDRLRRSPL